MKGGPVLPLLRPISATIVILSAVITPSVRAQKRSMKTGIVYKNLNPNWVGEIVVLQPLFSEPEYLKRQYIEVDLWDWDSRQVRLLHSSLLSVSFCSLFCVGLPFCSAAAFLVFLASLRDNYEDICAPPAIWEEIANGFGL